MAQNESDTPRMKGIPREILFLILAAVCTATLFIKTTIPNRTQESSADMFKVLMNLPADKTVLLQSDWTKSTRGENQAHFDTMMRILMRRHIKVALISVGDSQAPEVARKKMEELSKELEKNGDPPYKPWEDWVFAGYYPGAEATIQSFASNFASAMAAKKDKAPDGSKQSVMTSPVLQNVKEIGDLGAYAIITGTKSSRIAIERLSGKVTMLAMVTGVMGPETFNYYQTRQLNGLAIGLKGAYDMELMMEHGLNGSGPKAVTNGKVTDVIKGFGKEESGKDYVNIDKGEKFIVPLHGAIILMIIVVVIGNVQTIREKRGGKA